MEEKNDSKTISLKLTTYKRLQSIGKKGETFDVVLQKLLDKVGA